MEEQSGHYRLGYRPDIEGLRAVAILLVVAAHAGVPVLRGGFVGVDVFYILSGYLITGLLVQEVETTGRIRFGTFYIRRLRRLLPALLLMVAVTCVVAQLVMPPSRLPLQASSASTAVLWLSNFQFAFWKWNYFAPPIDATLFVHTWSLGVEEQFYLIWPLLVALVAGAWKRSPCTPNMARLKWLFIGIFVASYLLALYWTRRSPMYAFYLMPPRAWQFALGAGVFLLVGSPAFRADSAIQGSAWLLPAGWIGLAMILLAARIIEPLAPYPGTWSLLPSFGAALALAAGTSRSSMSVHHMLSWRPMQALGRVSYSWYLWHWPVLILGAMVVDATNGLNQLLLVLFSLMLALLSYHFFETPIRHQRQIVAKPRLAIIVALAMMIIASAALHGWLDVSQKHLQTAPELKRFAAAKKDSPGLGGMGCYPSTTSSEVRICSFGRRQAKHTAVILGDSKAAHWVPAYRQVFNKPDWRLLVVIKLSCPMVDAPFVALGLRREFTECADWREKAVRQVAALRPDVAILSEDVAYPFTQRQWVSGTQHVLQALAPDVHRIYLMRPTPELPFDGRLCAEPRSRLYHALVGESRCSSGAHTAHFDEVGEWLRMAAAPFHDVQIVDMTNSVCPGGVCRAEVNGVIVFRDSGHMSATFSRSLAPALAAALESENRRAPKANAQPRSP